jgi:nitrilase
MPKAKPGHKPRSSTGATRAREHRVAVVQHPPVLLDLARTMDRAIDLARQAAKAGARLITFPETYLPGYPEWVWRLRPDDRKLAQEIHGKLIRNCVDVEAGGLAPLQAAAKRFRVTVVMGLQELDGAYSRSSIYNAVVTIGPDGSILNKHRKLMPTNPERMVWAIGDGAGLRVVDTPAGRVGSLICWENYMPLARFSIYAQGPEIYVAPTWDEGDGWTATMRHIAQEGRCWVLGNGTSIQGRDIPRDFPGREQIYPDPDDWINAGDSVIVGPDGGVVAGPLHEEHGILYAECDPARAVAARRTLDVAGHYGRPDIFHLDVARDRRAPIAFSAGPESQ